MPCRVFRDPDGDVWTAWDVLPKGLLERRVAERRLHLVTTFGAQNRRTAERRVVTNGRRTSLRGELAMGWLCFESPAERRRLTPIPDNWQREPDERLVEYCREATPVKRSQLRLERGPEGELGSISRRDIA